MAEMRRSASASILAPEFDDFLFASIGEERNGMRLSVVSALARLDVDPWQEAANLARLPGTTATHRLASLIAALPDRPSTHLAPGTIAACLIARLPRRIGADVPSADGAEEILGFSIPAVMQSQPFRYGAIVLMVIVLGGLAFAASHRATARAANAEAAVSGGSIPQTSGR